MLRDRRKGLTEGGGGSIIVRRRQRAGGLPPEDVASERDAFRRPLTGGSEHGEPTARRLAAADAPGQGAPEPRAAWQGEERGGSGRVARRGTEPSGPRLSPVTGTPGNRTCPAAGGSCICLTPPGLSALPRPPPEWESGRVGEWESGRVGEWESGRVGEWETGRRLRRTPVTGPGGRAGDSGATGHRSGAAPSRPFRPPDHPPSGRVGDDCGGRRSPKRRRRRFRRPVRAWHPAPGRPGTSTRATGEGRKGARPGAPHSRRRRPGLSRSPTLPLHSRPSYRLRAPVPPARA